MSNSLSRARKIEGSLVSHSLLLRFTGTRVFTELKDTIRGFREILDSKHDDIPEKAFLYAGTIDEVVEKAKKLM